MRSSRSMGARRVLLACLVCAGVVGLAPVARRGGEVQAFPDHPPVAHTGGFGEPTCAKCHAGRAPNAPGGTLALEGVPDAFEAGKRYRLVVALARPEMASGGFQLAARCGDGRQAGELSPGDAARVAVAADARSGVRYAHQTADGAEPAEPGRAAWTVEWTAPAQGCPEVRFDAAANAANGDQSALGDYVYTRSLPTKLGAGR
ncbi:MAG: choice-of-anchor V domain-containing protein [Gemmatimonadota bacterium]